MGWVERQECTGVHSPLVTCVSPHEAIVYTVCIRRAWYVSPDSGTPYTLQAINQTSHYRSQTAADTLTHLGYQVPHISNTTHHYTTIHTAIRYNLGTAVRIPCEVLKQRLQAGLFDNVGQAFVATWEQDGLRGFFRGTGATLCREVPFYVAGMGLYAESKKVVERLLERELSALETIAVGALSGGLAAVVTTPFDVMKTRMMTAQGRSVSMTLIAFSILKHEGPLGLFKGAVPRFFWIAPLGAMNFAGYELAKKAMNKNEEGKAGSSE